jgi:hypothetical protein
MSNTDTSATSWLSKTWTRIHAWFLAHPGALIALVAGFILGRLI